jgi:hypothetical protein
MWYKDTPGHQYKRTTDNKGFTARKALTAQSKSVQMMGKTTLGFILSREIFTESSRDVFALMADADTYKIKIKDLALL